MTVVLSLALSLPPSLPLFLSLVKRAEVTAMNSYANSDALSRTLGVVKEKETRRDETNRRSNRIRNKKAIYVLRTTSSSRSSFFSCFYIYMHYIVNMSDICIVFIYGKDKRTTNKNQMIVCLNLKNNI